MFRRRPRHGPAQRGRALSLPTINHIQQCIERAAPEAPIRQRLPDPKENTGEQNSGCRPGAYRVSHRCSGPADQNVGHRSVHCFVRVFAWDRAGAAPPFAALPRAHVFVHRPQAVMSMSPSRSGAGPARVGMPRLQRRRPDATALVDAFPRTDRPDDPFGMPHPYPAAGPLARSGRDEVAVGLTGSRAHGRCAARTLAILSNRVGAHGPQYPVATSIRFRRGARDCMPALPAGDEAA